MEPWIYFLSATLARRFVKRRRPRLGRQRTLSIYLSEGGEKTQRYQCVSFLPGIHQRAAVRQPKASARWERPALPLVLASDRPRQRGNLSLIVSHFPSASSRSDAGGVVKWNTYTNMHKQTQTQRPRAMRPFFIVIMTGPSALSANTTDLYSGSPLQREQVCVSMCLDVCVRVWGAPTAAAHVPRR